MRAEGETNNSPKAARVAKPAKPSRLETSSAAYAVDDQDFEANLGVLLDHAYGAPAGKPRAERPFVPGIDGLAGGKKWQPYVEFNAAPGNRRSMGQVNLFAPLMQDSDSLLFTDLRASAWTGDVQEGNFGIGYRQIVPGGFFGTDAIFGLYGYLDARRSAYDNMFYQGTVGAEIITNNFEFRVNGYLPSGSQYVVGAAPGGGVTLNGRNVVFSGGNLVERALPGFDVEAGVKIDFSEAAIRLNAGYFRFERGDTLVEGPRFRAEVEIEDPFGFDGATLSLGGEIRDDKVRGTDVSGLVRLRVPIGGANSADQAERQLTGLDRLMTRRIYRDDDIVTPLVQAVNPAGSGAVTDSVTGESLQVFFVANTAQGAADCSNVGNACDFVTAQGLAGAGDTFVPVDVAGAIGSVFTLNNDRQQVIGGGDTGAANIVLSDSANSVLVLTSLGGRPIVTGINLVHFADSRVAGLTTNTAAGITGNGMTGTIAVDDVVMTDGGIGFTNSGATINVTDAAITSNAASGVVLNNFTGLRATLSNVDVVATTGIGLSINGGTGDVTTDANSSISKSGAGAAVAVVNGHTGRLIHGGQTTVTGGTGLQFNNADGTYNFSGPSNLAGGDAGIDILAGSSGTFTFSQSSAILSPTGIAFNVDGSSATVNYAGSITQNNAASAVSITNNTGGSVTFDAQVNANTSTATGINLANNGGATVSFIRDLNIDTTTGTGFSATGGGTVNVRATAFDQSILSTSGQAINLNGVTIGADGINFDSISSTGSSTTGIDINGVGGGTFTISGATTVSGAAGNGIQLTGNASAINFNGATGVTVTGASVGVDLSGTSTGAITFADLDIALQSATATALDLSGATINANLTATDFDVTSASATGTTGVDLSGTTGTGTIRLGDANVNGASASIAGVNVGVRFTGASNTTFIFGDGEDVTDKGSSISGTTAISGGSTVTMGSYDFDDVNFTGTLDFTPASSATLVFVAANATGDGSGSDVNNRANVVTADAITTANTTFVLIDDGAAIDDVDGFTLTDGQTMASFGNGRTFATSGLVIPANFSGVPGTSTTVTDPTGNGAAILTRTGGAGDTLTASGTVNLQDFIVSNAAAGAGLTATGATTIMSTGLTVQNVAGRGIDLNSLTGAASTFNNTVVSTTTGNAVDIVNSNVNFSGGLDIDTTSGTGFSATGGGTVNVTAGALPNSVAATAGQAIEIDGVMGSLNFTTLVSTGAANNGISIANFAAGSSFSVSGATTVSASGDDNIDLNSVGGSVTFSGAVTLASAADDGIDIQDSSNGTITFQSTVTITDAADSGIEINGFNAGPAATGTVAFNGLVDIDRSGFAGIDIFDRVGTISFATADIDTVGVAGVRLMGAELDGTLSFSQLDINGGAGSQVGLGIAGVTTGPIDIDGGLIENIDGEAIGVLGSNVTLTYTGTVTQATAGEELVLVGLGDTSTLIFEAGSVLQATDGTGLHFEIADGSYTFAGTTTLDGGDAGIDILNGSLGTFTFGSNTAIRSPSGTAFNLDASAATVNYNGTITQNNAASAVTVTNNTGGTVTFAGLVTANTSTANAVGLTNNTGSIAFSGGLNIDTTSGTGFNATGGGTVSVSATAGDESIVATAGQALNLNGMTIGAGGVTFDSISSTGSGSSGIDINGVTGGAFTVSGATTVSGAAGNGVQLTGNASAINFNGATSVTVTGATAGIDLSGTSTGAITFADLDIALQSANATALDLSGAVINAGLTAGDFDVTSTSATGTIGINLTGTTGTGAVQIGDTNQNGGPTVTIGSGANMLATGVLFSAATNLNFTLGDGDGAAGDLTASDMHATTALGGTLSTNGNYNFRDIDFNASGTANLSGPSIYYVDAAGAGTGASQTDAGSIAGAELFTGDVIVLIDTTQNATSDAINMAGAPHVSGGAANSLDLDDGQVLVALFAGQTIDLSTLGVSALGAPGNYFFTGITAGGSSITGAATLDSVAPTLTTNSGNTVNLAGSAGIQGVTLTNTGTGDGVSAPFGSGENVVIRSSTIGGGTGGDAIDIATTAGASTFDFSNLTLSSGLRLNGTAGGTLTGTMTGTNTIDNTGGDGISITNAAATISGVTFGSLAGVTGAGIVVSNTDATSRTVALSNLTMGSGGNGDTGDVDGIGIDINSSGTGVLTVNLTGTNVIRSTGQALDVDETAGVAAADKLLLTVNNTTFESAAVGVPSVEVTGQNGSATTSSVGVRGFANNTVIGNSSTSRGGILFTAVDFDSDGAGGQVAGGTLNIGQSAGARVRGDGLSLINTTGDLAFTTLNVFNDNGTGLEVNTKGAGTTFNLVNAGGTVNTTNGTALFLDPLTMNLTFGAVTATGGANGVFIDAGDASGGAGSNALTITTLNVTGSTGAGLRINNSTGTFNFGTTTINNTATGSDGVDIDLGAGDTAVVSFTNGLDIDTSIGTGFDANGTAGTNLTVNVANAATKTINTTSGAALIFSDVSTNVNIDAVTATALNGNNGITLADVFGTFAVGGGTITNTGAGTGIMIGDGSSNSGGNGTVSIATAINSTGATGVAANIRNVFGGTVTLSGNLTDNAATGGGISASGNTGGTITFSGATKTLNTGAVAAVSLTSNTGAAINFTNGVLDIDTTNGAGLAYNAGGTVNITSQMTIDVTGTGGGLSVLNDGTGSFTANNAGNTIATVSGTALEVGTSTVNATFASVSASALNGNHGISTFEHSGTLTVNGGTLTNLGGQDAIQISGGSGTISIASNINSTGGGGLALDVNTRTGGTFTHSGNLIDDGTQGGGISLSNNAAGSVINISGASKVVNTGAASGIFMLLNTGATVNFTGATTDIDTTTADAVVVNGGGTINFNSSTSNTINATSGRGFRAFNGGTVVIGGSADITTTTGTAVDIQGTTIGAGGVTFRSVSANGAVNGIVLNNTGAGAFTVTGDASTTRNASGGTIQNTTGDAIRLFNASNVTLENMNILSGGANGVFGTAVNGFAIRHSIIRDNGNAVDEGQLRFADTNPAAPVLTGGTGTFVFDNILAEETVAGNNAEHLVEFINISGTMNMTVSGSTFQGTINSGLGADGFLIETRGSADSTVNVTGSTFQNNATQGFQGSAIDSSALTVNIGTSMIRNNNEGIVLSAASSAALTFDINNNAEISGHTGTSIFVGTTSTATASSSVTGHIRNNANIVHNSAVNHGIIVFPSGDSVATVNIENNTITGSTTFRMINVTNTDNFGDFTDLAIRIVNNLVTNSDVVNNFNDTVYVEGRRDATVCATISANAVSTANGRDHIRLRERDASTVRLEQGSASIAATADAALETNNPATIPGTQIDGEAGVAVVANGTCRVAP